MNGFYFMLIKIHGISHTRVVPHFIKSIVKFQNPSCEVTGSINFTLFSSAPLPHNVARFWEMHIVAISYLKAFGALDYQDVSIEDRISLFLGMVFIVLGTTDIPSSFPHLGYGKFCEAVYGIST